MKTCLTILLSLLFCSMAQSQYKYLRNYDDDVHAIIPCQDSTYYTVSIHPGCGINSFSVHYIGRHGQLIWSKESQIWVSHLNNFKGFTDENNVLTLIYSSLDYNGLTRMDRTGTIIFNRYFNSSPYRMNSITPTTGGFYLTGIQNEYSSISSPSVPVLLKMDNSGQVIWVKSYSIPTIPRLLFHDVQQHGDSLLIVGNYTQAGFPEVTFPYILKTDLNGNTGSSNYYRIETIDVDRYKFTDVDSYDPASIYLKFNASTGIDGILKLNEQLQPVWCKNAVGVLGTICASYEGGVMFSSSMSSDGDIINLNTQGTIIGSTATGAISSTPSIILRHDCGYLVALPSSWPGDRYAHISQDQVYCGAITGFPGDLTPINTVTKHPITVNTQTLASSTFSLIVLTGAFTDNMLTETVDCIEPYSCSGPLGLSEQELTSDLLYPNPATDVIHIETSDSPIVITDAAGAVVYSGTLTNNELNIRFLAPGLYHVNCNQQRRHFIKQ
ncbi:T9SS type A sorting domain-containing protein [Fluviicola taffensis]|uniref:T9SS type A sorting domain-containing protein n=1 Tax=Fluviicola taffensis TaxID=191579 RepID=UPI0031376EF3